LKAKLRADLTAAMKARDELTVAVLRMALAAVTTEEVSGKEARELSDDEVLRVLGREQRKRREAAEAFGGAGRTELAARERAEGEVLDRYLPTPLSDEEVAALAAAAVDEVAAGTGERPGMRQLGQVMRVATAKAGGRAEGGRVAAAVRAALSS
jgi:hypothetical protein